MRRQVGALRPFELGPAALLAAALAAAGCGRAERVEPSDGLLEIRTTTVRGHVEGKRASDGSIVPVFYDPEGPFGICFQIPTGVDTSIWQATVELDASVAVPVGGAERIQVGPGHVCFQRSYRPGSLPSGSYSLCASVRERAREISGKVCRRIELRGTAATGEAAPLFLAVRRDLVAIHSLLERETTLEEIEDRLQRLPRWLDQPEASELAAQSFYLGAVAEVDLGGSLQRAQDKIRRAQEAFEAIASPNWPSARLLEADILSRVGAAEEATDRLRWTESRCRHDPAVECEESLLPSLYGGLAWLLLLRQDPGAEEISQAAALLEEAIEKTAHEGEEERANRLLNLAYLRVLQGASPSGELERARGMLAASADGERRRQLLAWADLVQARELLARGEAGRALALCQGLGARHAVRDRLLQAWGASCTGEAHLGRGDAANALAAYERALLLHEHATPSRRSTIPIGADRLADDFYHAAWIAATRLGDPQRGLAILDRLDLRVVEAERHCLETLRPPQLRQVGELQDKRDLLLELNRRLEEENPTGIDEAGLPGRRRLQEEIQELTRRINSYCPPSDLPGAVQVDIRAVPLPHGVLLFERISGDSRVRATFRQIRRSELKRRIDEISAHFDGNDWSEETWRDRLQPLSRLLLPEGAQRLAPQTSFALYGILQGVPLSALPVGPSGEPLAHFTTVVLRPAALPAQAAGAEVPGAQAKALFLVNPTLDLETGGAADFYLQHFPQAMVLSGRQARTAVLKNALHGVDILHFDGHGELDPAFPELSRLRLSDGELSLSQIHELHVPRGLVNLSGCETGRWPVTADSGRYGLAGRFTRLGTRWVIGSRGRLDNRLAHRFNRELYLHLTQGQGVAESFGLALQKIREEKDGPSRAWAGLLLLGAGEPGQSSPSHTPSPLEKEVRVDRGLSTEMHDAASRTRRVAPPAGGDPGSR